MSFIAILLVVFALNFGLSAILGMFIQNPYLIQIIVSMVIALAYAIWMNFRVHGFLKTPRFYKTWLYIAAIFIIFDMIMNLIL